MSIHTAWVTAAVPYLGRDLAILEVGMRRLLCHNHLCQDQRHSAPQAPKGGKGDLIPAHSCTQASAYVNLTGLTSGILKQRSQEELGL